MIITVDTGGTKTLVASFTKEGKVGEQIKFPTPKDPRKYVKALRELLVEKYSTMKVDVIVVALPGIIKDGTAIWCNNLKWKNFNAVKALSGVLGDAHVLIENDANLAGLAETRHLKKLPISSLYVTVSTGIGTGVITNGHIDPGVRNSEAGHSLIEYRGKVSEWESFAAGSAIVRVYGQYARDIKSKRIWNEIADRISRGFLALIPVLQPEVIIIGGSIGTYFDKYGPQLTKILKKKLPNHIALPKIIQAKHPEEAVIYGCYYYAIDSLSDK